MTDTLTYEVRRVADEQEMAASLQLRHAVFCEEQGVPEREELDGRDRDGMHLVAVAGQEVLATCRLLFVGPTVQFSRLAVRADARRDLHRAGRIARGLAFSALRVRDCSWYVVCRRTVGAFSRAIVRD